MLKTMYVHDSKTPRSAKKLAFTAVALMAALAALAFWMFGPALTTAAIVGAGVVALGVVAAVAAWTRSRQRRQLTDLRDSALW